jgi:hypothetical protein
MIHRLDPAVPLVWRDPNTLQLGVERVVCVFPSPSAITEHLLTELRRGAPRGALVVTATMHGTRGDADSEVDALLASVAGALLPLESLPASNHGRCPPAPFRIAVDGVGHDVDQAAARLTRLLRECGHQTLRPEEAFADHSTPVAAAVILGNGVIAPWRHAPWLRRDVPHLPLVFGDDGVTIGPFVDSGGPCLRCLSLARTDADPAWPAISVQLEALAWPPQPALLSAHAAAVAAQWVDARVRHGDRTRAATSIRLRSDGSLTEQTHRPHPRCGCRALPENVTALADLPRSRTSSMRADVARG